MKRFIMHSDLKPEKVQDYIDLHANPWPELLELIAQCNIHNYSISVYGNELYTYYEYTGENYEADMEIMDSSPILQYWQSFSKKCFLHDDVGHYYDDLKEVFYTA